MEKWQDDWRVGKEEVDGEVVKNAGSAFQSYIYKQIKGRRTQADGGAKDLVFLVIRTGKSPQFILQCLIADIKRKRTDPNYKPSETEKRKFTTRAQKAKKAHDHYRYARNKTAAY